VKVTVANAFHTNDGRWYLSIDLTNVGRLPVTIIDVGVLVERPGAAGLVERVGEASGRVSASGTLPIAGMPHEYWIGPALSHRLIDGEAATYLVLPAVVAAGIAQEQARHDVRAYARLATGKRVESGNRIDVVNLARLE
jgi:hypothetical protein